jgi:excisionase family DNA binding protein
VSHTPSGRSAVTPPATVVGLPAGEPGKEPERLMSIREAAAYVGTSTRTITRLVVAGDLKAYRFGQRLIRLRLSDLDALLVPVIDGGDAA